MKLKSILIVAILILFIGAFTFRDKLADNQPVSSSFVDSGEEEKPKIPDPSPDVVPPTPTSPSPPAPTPTPPPVPTSPPAPTPTPEPSVAGCAELYAGHNNANANRINLVFEGVKYSNLNDFLKVIRNFVDLNSVNSQPGLLGQEPFRSNKHLFNFWYVDEINTCYKRNASCGEVAIDFFNVCQLPNKYYIRLFNRFDPDGVESWNPDLREPWIWAITPNINNAPAVNARHFLVHEFGHFFSSPSLNSTYWGLRDEYGGETRALEYDFFRRAGKILPNIYIDQETTTRSQCLEGAPWREFIGDGCGQPGVVDCVESYTQPEIDPREYESVQCRAGVPLAECYREVSCFEGAMRVEKNVFRPTFKSIMDTINPLHLEVGFNLPSQQHLCRIIKTQLGTVGGVCPDLLN
ncbi:MAG: M64 family metallopeptidase [Patescibacteria group bacterium]|nr:M64 family metallopeptidase [Patescibacteria group bacterium]